MDDTPIPSSSYGYLWQLPVYRGHYFARSRDHQWGRASVMLFLTDLSIAWYTGGAKPLHPIGIGDISYKDGTAPPEHHTHTYGSCVDIYILHKDGAKRSDTENKITYADAQYDQGATKALAALIVKIIQKGYQPKQILYDDPVVQSVWPGRIQTSKERPHHDHFHIQLLDPNPYAGKEREILSMSMLERRAGF